MSLLYWTTCFPVFEALTATLNINCGSGQLKARTRSSYCHTGKQSWGNFALPARVQKHSAQLGAHPLQRIIKGHQYPVPCLQRPYWKPACPSSAREPLCHCACFPLQPQVYYSCSMGWTRKFVKGTRYFLADPMLSPSWIRSPILSLQWSRMLVGSQLCTSPPAPSHIYNAVETQ